MATKAEEKAERAASVKRSVAKDTAKQRTKAKIKSDRVRIDKARSLGSEGLNKAKTFVSEAPAKIASKARGLSGTLSAAKTATTSRAGKVVRAAKDRLTGTFRGAQGGQGRAGRFSGGPSATGPTRASATQAFDKVQNKGKGLRRFGRLAKGASKFIPGGAAVDIGLNAALSTQQELETSSGLPEVRPLIGQQPEGQAPGAQAPVNLQRTFDPLLAAARPAVGALRQSAFIPAEGDAPAQPDLTRRGAGGLNPAQGLREFTNPDATAALADRSPGAIAARRGTASLEENQGVINRLIERNQGLRAQQFTQAQPEATQQPGTQSSAGLDQLGRQAAGGGLASAFGALALGGNQLRRDAADRTRAAAGATEVEQTRLKADLDLRNKLTTIGAQNEADAGANFQKDITSLAKDRSALADPTNPSATDDFDSAIVESAINSPSGNAAQFAQGLLGDAIFDLGPQTRIGAALNPFGEGRTFLDAASGAFRGEFNTADIANNLEKVQIDDSGATFRLVVPRQEGGGFEDLGDLDDLSEPMRRFALQILIRQSTGQRGDQDRANPNVATQTPRGLRQ